MPRLHVVGRYSSECRLLRPLNSNHCRPLWSISKHKNILGDRNKKSPRDRHNLLGTGLSHVGAANARYIQEHEARLGVGGGGDPIFRLQREDKYDGYACSACNFA